MSNFFYLAASSTAEDPEFQETEKFNMIWRAALILQYINHLLKSNTTMAGWITLQNTQVAN